MGSRSCWCGVPPQYVVVDMIIFSETCDDLEDKYSLRARRAVFAAPTRLEDMTGGEKNLLDEMLCM